MKKTTCASYRHANSGIWACWCMSRYTSTVLYVRRDTKLCLCYITYCLIVSHCRATTWLKLSRTTPTTHTTHPETHDPCGYTPNAHRRLTDWPPTHAVPCAMIETLAAWPGNRASWHHVHRPHTHTDTHAERWPAAGCVSSAGHIWMTTGDHGAN